MTGDEQEALMVRYFLGLATEEERTQVEERFFSESEYFDQLLGLEDSLIDDFVTGRMPADQRSAFKQSFDLRKEDVRFAQVLIQSITKKKLDEVTPPLTRTGTRIPDRGGMQLTSSLKRYGIAASIAALVLLTINVALFLRNQALRRELSGSRTEVAELREENETAQKELDHERSLKESSARELENERNKRIEAESRAPKGEPPDSQGALSDFVRIRLGVAFNPRGSGPMNETRVAKNVHWLRFEIPIRRDSDYESYRMSIKPVGQRVVAEKEALKTSGRSPVVLATVAADKLMPGDYVLTLYAEKAPAPRVVLGEFSFRIKD